MALLVSKCYDMTDRWLFVDGAVSEQVLDMTNRWLFVGGAAS